MLFDILSSVFMPTALGLLGWRLWGWPGALAGVACGAAAVQVVHTLRGRRFVQWLREPDLNAPSSTRGLWGDAAYRVAKMLRGERERVRESAQRLDDFLAAIQASPNGVLLLDSEGRIEWFNAIAGSHLGLDAQRDLLQHIGNLVRQPAFTAYLAARNFDSDVELIGQQDRPGRPVRLSVQIFPYGAGQQLLLSRDITALAQAEAMRRDFIANVSHELRTPLTVLAGFVETLQTLPLTDEERATYLGMMATQSERMQTLISDLLMLSRLEGSPQPGMSEQVDLGAMMALCQTEASALSSLLYPDDAKPQSLIFGPVPGFGLTGSASELRSAISNLINNAVRYTPAGGRIEVRWEQLPDGRARLAVTDSGPGIAPEHLPRLGERFYRVDRSRSRESGGTGLGLAITKHVVQRHGGELQISSTLGKGACFALCFPAVRVQVFGACA
ncbi:phosphate regulon sensor histidine kinase PhoR [Ottowia sp.]|uniref:phosphate regulon sensor histidine kinase PhoR n=1 Tax=Ottowia sp. TaxID=1898956 RepID=UPI003A8390FD